MKRINYRLYFLICALLFAAIGYLVFFLGKKNPTDVATWIDVVSKSVTIELALWLIFKKWLWKLSIFQGWLVPFPCLHGTWRGFILSSWVDPNTQSPIAPISVQLSIFQTFTTIRCTQRTGESTSRSFAEEILIDEDDPLHNELVFCYRNMPRETVKDRSAPHEGACVLSFSQANGTLSGYYWTNRRPLPTIGQIELSLFSSTPLDALSSN